MRKLLAASILLVLVFVLTGCGSEAAPRLRAVHNSPDAPNVDIYVSGVRIASDVPYLGATSYTSLLRPGRHEIKVNVAGTDTTAISARPNFSPKTDYTVLAVGYAGGMTPGIEPLLLTDDNTAPTSGNAKVRVIHGAPSAPAVDVWAGPADQPLSSGVKLLENVPYKAAAYVQAPAGSYRVRVTLAGTETAAIDSVTAVPLTAGKIYTVIAVESPGGGAPYSFKILADN